MMLLNSTSYESTGGVIKAYHLLCIHHNTRQVTYQHNSRDRFRQVGGEEMTREQTTIRLPVELKEQLQQEAERQEISFNKLVMMAIKSFLQDNPPME